MFIRRTNPLLGLNFALIVALLTSMPALAQDTVLIIGNSDYNQAAPACVGPPVIADLPGVVPDVIVKHNALRNAGWVVVNMENLLKPEMELAINNNIPTDKRYIVWYAGNGNDASNGEWFGVDCDELLPADLIRELKDTEALVILDSGASGAFAVAVNAALGANAADVGFITSTTGVGGAFKVPAGGLFTQCFVDGLNGPADANGDGDITVAEGVAYVQIPANCPALAGQGQVPTWDGDHAGWVIGKPKAGAGACTLQDGRCVKNISQEVCVKKGGKWDDTSCIPTVSEWGLGVMGLLVLTGGTIVVMRRRGVSGVQA